MGGGGGVLRLPRNPGLQKASGVTVSCMRSNAAQIYCTSDASCVSLKYEELVFLTYEVWDIVTLTYKQVE